MIPLQCSVQNYAWGKIGAKSMVYKLLESSNSSNGDELSVDKPFAELWMGCHPSGPSKTSHGSLIEYIEQHPDCLGNRCRQVFGSKSLPFLFKVLSVNKALSIQAHPNKEFAELLHGLRPDIYKDDNHKPEMAIALTEFEALIGFRPVSEILIFIRELDGLASLLESSHIAELEESIGEFGSELDQQIALKKCFRDIMTAPPENVESSLLSVHSSIIEGKRQDYSTLSQCYELFLRLEKDFPGDVGCLVVFLLNYITLKPNEAVFLEASLPHAYLFGDCIECMACSDNVVRSGLTPKFKDVITLCYMLDYQSKSNDQIYFQPIKRNEYIFTYDPPVPDFAVDRIQIPGNSSKPINLSSVSSASILLIISGEAKLTAVSRMNGAATKNGAGQLHLSAVDVKPGNVFFVDAGQDLAIQVAPNCQDFLLFRAYTSI